MQTELYHSKYAIYFILLALIWHAPLQLSAYIKQEYYTTVKNMYLQIKTVRFKVAFVKKKTETTNFVGNCSTDNMAC